MTACDLVAKRASDLAILAAMAVNWLSGRRFQIKKKTHRHPSGRSLSERASSVGFWRSFSVWRLPAAAALDGALLT